MPRALLHSRSRFGFSLLLAAAVSAPAAAALFHASWRRAWLGVGARGPGDEVRDALLRRYGEPHRKYHTLQHLQECLQQFEAVRDAADHPDAVEVALWFHDAIYALRAPDNEARSADWAKEALEHAGAPPEAAARVQALILATQHTRAPATRDEQVLIDVDLSILGAPAGRFAQYEHQIREEYAHVPGILFRLKRRAVLQSFLDRAVIYHTPQLHSALEAQARNNLAIALTR